MALIPDQIYSGVHYGITHDESIYDTAKYMIAVEVSKYSEEWKNNDNKKKDLLLRIIRILNKCD